MQFLGLGDEGVRRVLVLLSALIGCYGSPMKVTVLSFSLLQYLAVVTCHMYEEDILRYCCVLRLDCWNQFAPCIDQTGVCFFRMRAPKTLHGSVLKPSKLKSVSSQMLSAAVSIIIIIFFFLKMRKTEFKIEM